MIVNKVQPKVGKDLNKRKSNCIVLLVLFFPLVWSRVANQSRDFCKHERVVGGLMLQCPEFGFVFRKLTWRNCQNPISLVEIAQM